MRLLLLGAVAACLTVNAAPARADWTDYYGAVVCEGDAALVRFGEASNNDPPAFAPPPAPFAHLFANATIADPSRCRLRDGRVVTFHQSELQDSMPYGAGGAISTKWFTLTVGNRVIYEREVFDRRDEPRADLSIIYDGERLTECRTQEGNLWESHEIPLTCTERPERLPGARFAHLPRRTHIELTRFARGNERFCRAMLQPNERDTDEGVHWPALIPYDPSNVVSFGADDTIFGDRYGFALGNAEGEHPRFDIDNDGVIDEPQRVVGQSHSFDAMFWIMPPPGVTREQIADVANAAIDYEGATPRPEGWRIYSGDQTAFERARYTTLTPAFHNGHTYFVARWSFPRRDLPNAVVLRPHADGSLEEICAFGYAD